MGVETVKSLGAVGEEEADVKSSSGGLFLSCGQNGVGVVENGGDSGKRRALGMGRAGSADKGFCFDTFGGCRLDELRDNELRTAEGFVSNGVVRGEVSEDTMEETGLEE